MEGAVQTALNAVWGVVHHLGGTADPANPGPGDRFRDLAPLALPGGARAIKRVDFRYGNLPGGGKAQLELWGK